MENKTRKIPSWIEEERHCRPDEICYILGIKKSAFYRMVKRVEDPLPSIKIPTYRVKLTEFKEWRERHRNEPWK